MKKRFKISLLLLICFIAVNLIAQNNIPSSPRSREAINRVAPKLRTELSEKRLEFGSPIFIRIFKESKELELWVEIDDTFKLFKNYDICTWDSGTLGPKRQLGDGQAPEGFYYVRAIQLNPLSNFHLSFNLGYPNRYDRINGRTGSALMVHGSCVSIGCYAMTDSVIEEIYTLADAAFRNGQPFFRVHIFPFRMTGENMGRHQDSEWIEFWRNLKEGYDFFETAFKPPNVLIRERRYVFEP
jgi:murein L,D-transpeptidase YafK